MIKIKITSINAKLKDDTQNNSMPMMANMNNLGNVDKTIIGLSVVSATDDLEGSVGTFSIEVPSVSITSYKIGDELTLDKLVTK